MKQYRTVVLILIAAGLVVALAACKTAPKAVPEGLSAAEIIQLGQGASDKDDYEAALFYYDTCRQRYVEDLSVVCECEYEIAFIYFKQERYEDAKALFTTLLARYEQSDARLLPAQYKILGEKILAKVNAALDAKKATELNKAATKQPAPPEGDAQK